MSKGSISKPIVFMILPKKGGGFHPDNLTAVWYFTHHMGARSSL